MFVARFVPRGSESHDLAESARDRGSIGPGRLPPEGLGYRLDLMVTAYVLRISTRSQRFGRGRQWCQRLSGTPPHRCAALELDVCAGASGSRPRQNLESVLLRVFASEVGVGHAVFRELQRVVALCEVARCAQ